MGKELRDYQEEAVKACLDALSKQVNPLLVAPTGAGKTVMAAAIMKRWQEIHNLPCYFFAHRAELLDQAQATMDSFGINGKAFSVFQRSYEAEHKDTALCIFDEAHHAVANSWKNVQEHFKGQAVAITATPDRLDRVKLESVGFTNVYSILIRDLINKGYLVKPLAQKLSVRVCDNILEAYDDALSNTASNVIDEFYRYNRKRAIVFLPNVETSSKFNALLREKGIRSAHLDGTSTKFREMTVDQFKRGEIDFLCNVSLFTEGFDCPEIDCVVLLRETKSRSLWSQMIGRGLRTAPGKTDCLILDPLWVSGTHTLQPADVFTTHEEAVCQPQVGLSDPLNEAEIQDSKAEERLIKRLKAMEKLEAAAEAKERGLIDLSTAVTMFGYVLPPIVDDKPATISQRNLLERLQVYAPEEITACQAVYLIDKLLARQRLGLATARQVRKLRQFGHDKANQYTFDQASHAIGSDWRVNKNARYRKIFK